MTNFEKLIVIALVAAALIYLTACAPVDAPECVWRKVEECRT